MRVKVQSNWFEMIAMHMGYCYTYIVASKSRTLYVGMTGNLHKRVFEHKLKIHDGFSATYNCNRLVWFERFADPSEAIVREKQLKRWSRAKKIALIAKNNPTWLDLSEAWYAAEKFGGMKA
jgi:putative endonuclease